MILQGLQAYPEADKVLKMALGLVPDNYELLEAYAENAMFLKDYPEAARRWQDVAACIGADTPQHVYDRMSDAYEMVSSWGGTAEENRCFGDRDKHDILAELHEKLQPELYLEIGVDCGISLSLARCSAIGVDPRPKLKLQKPLKANAKIITASSDIFFRDYAQEYLTQAPDLVFIDGMHLFEFALRDFINVERHAKASTLVVIDDIHPCHPTQALRRRQSGAWTGDVWKLHEILMKYRPDLQIVDLNAHTTGLLLIYGLDSTNRVLRDKYDFIVEEYQKKRDAPLDRISRKDAVGSDIGMKFVFRV